MPPVLCSLDLRSAKYLNWRGALFLANTIRNLDIVCVKLSKIYLVTPERELLVQRISPNYMTKVVRVRESV
jgi:hypothetical protein